MTPAERDAIDNDAQKACATIGNGVTHDAPGGGEIGFCVPERYNASAILFDNLMFRQHRCAVTGPAGQRSYAQLAADAACVGAGLVSLGLQRGDRVLLFLDDTPAYPAALFGAIRAGFVPLLINTLTPPIFWNFISPIQVRGSPFAMQSSSTASLPRHCAKRVLKFSSLPTEMPWRPLRCGRWLRQMARSRRLLCSRRYAPRRYGVLDVLVRVNRTAQRDCPSATRHALHASCIFASSVAVARRRYLFLPFPEIFFAYGFGNSITFPFAAGATSVLLPGQPKPEAVFDAMTRYRPTVFFGLPTLYTALCKSARAKTADLSSLRLCVSAAEVLAGEVFNAWKTLSGLEIMEGLGSSEVLHIYLSNTAHAKKIGSAGKRVPGYEVSLRDGDGREVADGEDGVLWVRGASSAPCYWKRPDKTAETMREGGWIYTGDRFTARC